MNIRAAEARLRTLRSTHLLDSLPEPAFDRLTRLATYVLSAPVALVTLVDENRQFFKSAVGLKEPWASRRETPLTHSFCELAIRTRAPLVVRDARQHPLLRDNPAISDLDVIAYAGIPLLIGDEAIGAFCVIDDKPREWTNEQLHVLLDLAASVISEIELRMALRAESEQRALTEALIESIGDGVLAMDTNRIFLSANEAARRVFDGAEIGKPLPADWAGLHRSMRPDGTPLASEDGALVRALRGEETNGLTFTLQGPSAREAVWMEASGRPVRNAAGEVVAGIAVYRDVTEKMRRADVYSTLVRSIPGAAVGIFDRDLRCVAFDGGLVPADGRPLREMVGRTIDELAQLSEGDPRFAPMYAMCRRAREGEEAFAELAHHGQALELRAAPIRDAIGRVTDVIVLMLDRTEARRTEAALRRSEQVHRAIVHHLPNSAVFMVDRDLRYVTADGPILEDVLRRAKRKTLIGRTVAEVTSDENRDEVLEIYRGAFAGESRRHDVRRGDRFMEVNAVPIFDEGRQVSHAMLFLYDVTERRTEAEELRRTRDLFARERTVLNATLENIEDGVVLLDADRRIILANRSYATTFALPTERLDGMSRDEFFARLGELVDDPAACVARLREHPQGITEVELARPRRRVLRRTETAVTLPTGNAFLVTWHDVTSERELLAERERQAAIDPLTRIANRRGAEAALSLEDARRKRTGVPLSVAVFDVDRFKNVNDVHGHATGDEVLRLVAETLAAQARVTDLIARWGGEEFLAVLPGPLDGAIAFAERARLAVEEARCPKVDRVTISAGVAEVAPGETPTDAIARADERLYVAKRGGRNRVAS